MYDRLTKTITRWSYGGVLWSHDRRNLPGNIYTNPLCEQQAEGKLVRREVTNSAACLALCWVYYLKHQAYTDHILHKSFLGLDVRPKASKAADLLSEHQSNCSTTCKPIKDHLEKISSIVGFDVKPDVSMLLQTHIWYVCDGGQPNKLESGVNWVT